MVSHKCAGGLYAGRLRSGKAPLLPDDLLDIIDPCFADPPEITSGDATFSPFRMVRGQQCGQPDKEWVRQPAEGRLAARCYGCVVDVRAFIYQGLRSKTPPLIETPPSISLRESGKRNF